MNPRHISLTFAKEVREALRDRRTLAILVLFPLVVYPLLTYLLAQVISTREKDREAEPSRVAVQGEPQHRLEIEQALATYQKQFLQFHSGTQPDVLAGRLDALVVVDQKASPLITLLYDASRDRSRQAEERLSAALGSLRPPNCEPRFSVIRINLVPEVRVSGYLMSKILPLFVMLMVLMGAFHPAIDVTAGERERGTLETLLTAPIRRTDLLFGKVLAVTLLACLAGLLNLGSMALTLFQIASQISPQTTLPWGRALLTSAVIFPAAFLFSSLFVALGATARTHKEAQHLLLPIYFLTLVPATVGTIGDYPLGPGLVLVPGLNLTLLARDLLAGHAKPLTALAVLGTTLLLSVLALRLGSRFYNSERLILAPIKGKAELPARMPMASDALVLYALAFFLFIYVFLPLQQRNLVMGILSSQWVGLFGLVLLYARFCHRPVRQVVHLTLPPKRAWIGAILIGGSAWIWVGALSDLILPVPKTLLDELRRLIAPMDGTRGLASTLFLMALTPAVCEEAFFRGPLLRGLRERLPGPSTAILTGLFFGLFHLEIYRLLPTTLLGILLSFLALTSGSILPSMLAHFSNNACLVLLAHSGWESKLQTLEGVAALFVIVPALCLTVLGMVLTRSRHEL